MTGGVIAAASGRARAEFPVIFKNNNSTFLSTGSALSGVSDSTQFTLSCWLVGETGADTFRIVYETQTGTRRFIINCDSVGRLNFQANSDTGSLALNTNSTFNPSIVENGVVHHLHMAIDMASTATRKVYIDGVDQTSAVSFSTYDTSATLDLTYTGWLACESDKSPDISVGHLWFAPGQYETDNTKFITAGGRPKNLGADGSTPTGVAPAIYFYGDKDDFPTNQGTGGAFTLTGTLTDSTVELKV